MMKFLKSIFQAATVRKNPAVTTYRLTVTCPATQADRVVCLLLAELKSAGLAPSQILRSWDEDKNVVQLIAMVLCQLVQRAVLVRFINRAGALPQVRQVRWEGVAPA
ncbi:MULTISPECIES: hypothetical protein [unclassified Janthinobacterium]|uniref:hypothetical protein n=1 Tax=unclassified Janthinobacterium TaxID=2610881 RepID=UPI00161A58CA|nr:MULTISPECIES: hypothetical protein [unclassified Janthinobacterium]MBB5610490.1 putative membrane protein YhiD involved in acid resistance [Janthinobacterium sp. S3T4]MBB5615848.1 putative membrane protein YhiD involved in acid resistance [Janthinobacterium sp. S3M3]